jgi:DNA-binding transcriptional LysR family regulator
VLYVPELQDVYRLQAFVAVVDEGSLSAAVSKLHITQPALSARLKLLEESLGCVLLERTGRGVRPTPLGKLVYGIAVDILKRMRHLQTTIQNHIELREGWIHLGGGATAVSGVFPDAIASFRRKFPNIQFTLQEQDSHAVVEAVRDGAVDIGIVTEAPAPGNQNDDALAGLKIHAAISDSLAVIASPRHPLVAMSEALEKVGKTLLPMHLNKQPMILFDEGSAIRGIIDLEFRRLYIHPKVVMTLRSTQSMLRMVQKGIGLSVVSKLSMQPPENDVHLIHIEGLSMRRALLIVTSEDRTLTPSADTFLKELIQLYGACPGSEASLARQGA